MFTETAVTMVLVMIAMLVAIIAGHYSGRDPDRRITDALFATLFVIPFGVVIFSGPFYNLVTLYDWPRGTLVLPPQFAIWCAAGLGGFLGFRSGLVWNRDGASCVYFLVTVMMALLLLSFVVVLIP